MQEKIQRILKEYEDINQQLSNPEISSDPKKFKDLSIKLAGLEEVRGLAENYIQTTKELNESGELLKSEVDPDMITMAEEEIKKLRENEADIKKKLEVALLPKDPNDNKNVIIEIRAGAGGDEAGLFAANLFRMYQRYSEVKGYKTEILSSNRSGIGGYKEIIFMIKGQGAYQNFKYESGVHRVQRVPETEKQGRIHTSTITVAVLPEAEEVDLEINPSDLRIDTFCAS
ncbi:PCRF domain-containing protein, partial [Patescibacteria group bacterium]|nr:PCRF domain-containing protein [Patescibacteria group bacterium]